MLLLGIQGAAGWFVCYVIAHIVLMRAVRPRLYFVMAFRLWLVLLIAYLGTMGVTGWVRGTALLNSVLVLGSLWAYYMIVTFNVIRSVSIRTVTELVRSPAQALTAEDLDRLYDTEAMFDRRIDSLVANRYLWETDGRLGLTARGRLMARAFSMVRRLFNLQTHG